MMLILSALLLSAQLPCATQSNELDASFVKTLTKGDVVSLLEILVELSSEVPDDAPPIFDLAQFQTLDASTKATLIPKLQKHSFTLDSFTESLTALFSAYFTAFPSELDALLPTLNHPAVVKWCKKPGRPKQDIKALRKKIRELQDNKGFMLAQLELTNSAANQSLVTEHHKTIQKVLMQLKRTFEDRK